MRKTPFLLIGLLLVSVLAVNLISPVAADEPRGPRNPGADVTVTPPPQNKTGIPTKVITYIFEVENTGDENDSFDIFVESENDWDLVSSHSVVGPLGVNKSTSVTVNTTIPAGWPAGTSDNLTFRARSNNDFGISDIAVVKTNVDAMFILSIDIDGVYQRMGLIDAANQANYTLSIKNKGNIDVTITLEHTLPTLPGWQVLIPDFPNKLVYIEEADIDGEFEKEVNITVQAPNNAQPDDMVTIQLWGKKTDITPNWYSWQTQENITLTTTVDPVLEITITPESYIGNVDFGYTIYNFTVTNSGNKKVEIDLVPMTNLSLLTSIDNPHMTVDVGTTTDVNVLRVNTAKNTPLGNYTIEMRAVDSSDGAVIGNVDLYYIVVPRLSINDISVSPEKPVQYESVTISATIENIGYADASNLTVRFYDGSKKIGETKMDYLNTTKTDVAKLKWSPSDFGNRSVRISIDVQGEGNFSEFGTAVSENIKNFDVKINWQPYYFVIFVIIVIILGFAFVASLGDLRYYSGVPAGAEYDEYSVDYGEEEMPPEGFPEEEGPEPLGMDREEREPAPFGTERFGEEEREPFSYGREERERYRPPPKPEPEPHERHPPPAAVERGEPRTPLRDHELKNEINNVKDKLYKTKSLGVDTANIDNLLSMANRSMDAGDTDKAKQYLKYANERLDGIMAKREEAVQAIREAKEVLSGMRDSADMTIVENFVVKADSLFEEGDFREAINYANKAKDRALRLQRREMRL